MKRGIVWFRNDLRLLDNENLHQAIQECDEIIPVYVFDVRQFKKDRWGHEKTGPIRSRFLFETIRDLKSSLQQKGSDLIIFTGKTEEALQKICKKYNTTNVYASKSYTTEELEIEQSVEQFATIKFFHTTTLVHPSDLPFYVTYLPDMFTQFRKAVEKQAKIREEFPEPETINSPQLEPTTIPKEHFLINSPRMEDSRAVLQFNGGSTEGLKRLNYYIWESEKITTYKKTRNGLIGGDYSSKFSAWLANGSISAKTIYYEVKKFEREVVKNQSTYWMIFELMWRDYFQYVAMKYGNRIFQLKGIKETAPILSTDTSVFEKWKMGKTEDDFVNANMLELMNTGFMSNRGRQNVASYLVHDLGLDWRMGASWFESQLIDYDPCSNYGNWIYVSGVGNDPRPNRKFNTQLQADRYDQGGQYRALWLEESAAL